MVDASAKVPGISDAPLELVDIGVNLVDKAFASDLNQVLDRAQAAAVRQMIVTGTSVAGSRAAAELAVLFPQQLRSTAGVHPHHASEFTEQSRTELDQLANRPEVVALGECGLDYNRMASPMADQKRAFGAQLDLAISHKLPVFVHERDAASDLLAVLDGRDREALGKICIHCFTGEEATLDQYLERDFYIGITGWICDERRGLHLRELVRKIPTNRLMIETDAPYLLPRTIRPRPKNRRNEPSYLPHVAAAIADACELTIAEVARNTTAVARDFFGLG